MSNTEKLLREISQNELDYLMEEHRHMLDCGKLAHHLKTGHTITEKFDDAKGMLDKWYIIPLNYSNKTGKDRKSCFEGTGRADLKNIIKELTQRDDINITEFIKDSSLNIRAAYFDSISIMSIIDGLNVKDDQDGERNASVQKVMRGIDNTLTIREAEQLFTKYFESKKADELKKKLRASDLGNNVKIPVSTFQEWLTGNMEPGREEYKTESEDIISIVYADDQGLITPLGKRSERAFKAGFDRIKSWHGLYDEYGIHFERGIFHLLYEKDIRLPNWINIDNFIAKEGLEKKFSLKKATRLLATNKTLSDIDLNRLDIIIVNTLEGLVERGAISEKARGKTEEYLLGMIGEVLKDNKETLGILQDSTTALNRKSPLIEYYDIPERTYLADKIAEFRIDIAEGKFNHILLFSSQDKTSKAELAFLGYPFIPSWSNGLKYALEDFTGRQISGVILPQRMRINLNGEYHIVDTIMLDRKDSQVNLRVIDYLKNENGETTVTLNRLGDRLSKKTEEELELIGLNKIIDSTTQDPALFYSEHEIK